MKWNNENSRDTLVTGDATLFSIAEDELLIVENQGQSRLLYGTTSGTLDGVLAPGEEEAFSASQYLKAAGGRQRCGVRVTTGRPSLPRSVANRDQAPLNFQAEGGVPDWTEEDGGTDNVAALQAAVAKANTEGRGLTIPAGDYWLDITTAADTILPATGTTIVFEPGARIVWGMEDRYFPWCVVAKKEGVRILDPTMLWTGALTYANDADHDFKYADDTGPAISSESTRYATDNAYSEHFYASGILVLESNDVEIRNPRGSSITEDDRSTIHAWICAFRVNDFKVTGKAILDDCCIAILEGGNDRGEIESVTTDRLSQDIGIPGHVVYSFMSDLHLGTVIDKGTESGANGAKQISHSVSVKGTGRVTIGAIHSRRPCGPLNIQNTALGGIGAVTWKDNAVASISTIPKLYLVPSTAPDGWTGTNIVLETARDEAPLLGGEATNLRLANVVLVRDDDTTPTTGFLSLKGSGNRVSATLVQRGSEDAKICHDWNGNTRGNRFELMLRGFHVGPQIEAGSSELLYNDFVIDNGWDETNALPGRPFGDPADVWTNAGSESDLASNRIAYPDGVTTYQVDGAATASVSEAFPVPRGVWLITATVLGGSGLNNHRSVLHRVAITKHGTSWLTSSELIGTTFVNGSGVTTPTVTPASPGKVTIASTLSGGNESEPHRVTCSMQRLA